jgi:P-type conjugative transfer protein TrbJ
MKRLSAILAITSIFYSLAASAQIATIDVTNIVQSTISAEQAVAQTARQIQQYQAQLQQLENQIKYD